MMQFDPGQINAYIRNQPAYAGSKGSVVRLRVTDFMTYHCVELRAGAHVNLILGPNGTGKSTIVCAICLGLAGKPKILGRALALKEYIRHGAKSASIEIELYNPNGLNYVIKRHIKEAASGTSSTWYLMGRKASPGAIEDLTASLNIQLDNLCQFLPQDRVQDFVVMDSASLLQNTQKALGSNLELYDRHQNLIRLTATYQEIEKNLKAHTSTLKTEKQYTQRLEKDVENYRDREALKTKVSVNTSKKAWVQYIKARDAFSKCNGELENARLTKKLEEAKLAPSKKAVEQLETKKGKLWVELNRVRSKNMALINSIKKKVEEEFDRVEVCVSEEQAKFDEQKLAEGHREKKVENVNLIIQNNEKQLEEIRIRGDADDAKLNRDLANLESKIKVLDDEILRIVALDDDDESYRRLLDKKIRADELELSRLDDLRLSRLRYLKREQPEVYDCVMYYENPDNRAQFKGQIYEPMVLHISVNDLKYGKVAERHISFAELYGFFCEKKEDVVVMLRINEKRGQRVSVTHYEASNRTYVRPRPYYTPEFLRKWDFQKVVSDLVEGPDYYLNYLAERFHLDRILIGSEETERKYEEIGESTNLSLFYTENSSFQIKRSNYSGSKVISYHVLPPARVMTTEINVSEKERLTNNVAEYRNQNNRLEASIKSRSGRKIELEAERQSVEDKIKDINARMECRKKLQQRLELAKKQLITLEREKIDLTSLKKACEKKIMEHRAKLLNIMDFVATEISKVEHDGAQPGVMRRQITKLDSRISSMQNDLEQMTGEVRQCEIRIKALIPQVEQYAKEAEAAKKDAISKSNNNTEIPPDVLNGKVSEKEIETELQQANVQLRFLLETDPGIVRDYHEKMRQIADIEKKKEAGERKLANIKGEIEREKEAWLTPLTDLIGTVNRNFGRFFANMGCAGEVVLNKGNDENDFSKYGIKILVKFRSSEPLSELGGNKGLTLQSGGERVISTALYILALQELTQVPFRVIDEINQGMDAMNEARFFNLLCHLAQGPNTPQYFLLSPKMLPATVEYPENVTFHFIYSGPHVNVPLEGQPAGASSDDGSGIED